MTFKQRAFAVAYAKSHDRRSALESAGYALEDWARSASRLLSNPQVLHAIEVHEEKLAKREKLKHITVDDIIGQLGEMLELADATPSRRGMSNKLRVLESLAKVLATRSQAEPIAVAGDPNKPLTDTALHERIAELERELQGSQTPASAPSDRTECHPPTTDAPAPPPAAITGHSVSDSQVEVKVPVLNMSANEREDHCDRHGSFVAVRHGAAWSFCPVCCAEAARYERGLANLAPAGGTN